MAMPIPDPRHLSNGLEIPTEHYSDQPYIVKTDDGAWLCVLTTGAGVEGQSGQHVVTLRSEDMGQSWAAPVDVEPADGPEASYAVLLKVPSGRLYCFYNHNTDNMREVIADDPPFTGGTCSRVDSLGHFVFKYSDDHGRTWSAQRYDIPMREMDIDRKNAYGGKVRFFWNVGKPFLHDGAAYVSCHKVGGFGEGFFTRSEGVLLRSEGIVTGDDPATFQWETLPEGELGLHTPPGGGPISEEQSYSVLSDGSFYAVYRTTDGHPCEGYSRDQGRTWTAQYKAFATGNLMKHPRAANFAWKCQNGKYLYWFHNHGGHEYEDRNPVWLCGGVEGDSPEGKIILWSQPEIILYDDDTMVRMSYPDLVEDDGRYFVTETQKDIARVHELDPALLEGLWGQFERAEVAREGLVVEWNPTQAGETPAPPGGITAFAMPKLPMFLTRDGSRADYGTHDLRQGLALDLWLQLQTLEAGQVLVDTRVFCRARARTAPSTKSAGETAGGAQVPALQSEAAGIALVTTDRGTVEVILNDGRTENRWDCDPGTIEAGVLHHLVVSVDGGPKIITFVVDGKLCDGGEARQFGWGRFSPNLRTPEGGNTLRLAPQVKNLRLYGRSLKTSEAISNYHAGLELKGLCI
ncbi:MAG: sialidase family protein [Bacteroidota bacterium]